MLRVLLVMSVVSLGLGCGPSKRREPSDSLFATPAAELAREHAPDLYEPAQSGLGRSREAERRKDDAGRR